MLPGIHFGGIDIRCINTTASKLCSAVASVETNMDKRATMTSQRPRFEPRKEVPALFKTRKQFSWAALHYAASWRESASLRAHAWMLVFGLTARPTVNARPAMTKVAYLNARRRAQTQEEGRRGLVCDPALGEPTAPLVTTLATLHRPNRPQPRRTKEPPSPPTRAASRRGGASRQTARRSAPSGCPRSSSRLV